MGIKVESQPKSAYKNGLKEPKQKNYSAAMTDTSLKGQANSLNEKYGGNILSYDTSGMTTDQMRGYNSDLFKYQNIMAYSDASAKAKQSAAEAESYANTRRMLMQKYMPDTLKAMGLSGTGASANTMLQMDNAYNSFALNAKAQAAQAEQNALKDYQTALAAHTQSVNEEKLLEAQTKSKDVRGAYESQITSRVDGLIANGAKLTQAEYNTIKNEIANNTVLTDEDKAALNAKLESYAMGNYGVYTTEEESNANAAKAEAEATAQAEAADAKAAQQETEYAKPDKYNINLSDNGRASKTIEPSADPAVVETNLGVNKGKKQRNYIADVLAESKTWTSKMNGTFVDFNYGNTGRSDKVGDIYVFIDGKWYLTNYTRSNVPDGCYSEPGISRGRQWSDHRETRAEINAG